MGEEGEEATHQASTLPPPPPPPPPQSSGFWREGISFPPRGEEEEERVLAPQAKEGEDRKEEGINEE